MQLDPKFLQDLRQQWKERSLRKSPYMNHGRHGVKPLNFVEYDRSTTRTEMPNKYHKPEVAKVEIEAVCGLRRIQTPESTGPFESRKFSTPGIIRKQSLSRPFYYTENNEIISVDQFFNIFKDVQAIKKKELKLDLQKDIEEKRKKIDTIRLSTSANLTRSISTASFSQKNLQSPRLNTCRTSRLSKRTNTFEMDMNHQLRTKPTTQRPATARVINQENIISASSGALETLNSGKSATPVPTIPFQSVTEQKFTQREIIRQLSQLTVSPRPMKPNFNDAKKEKSYRSMYKGPKTMDSTVENSIKKARNIIKTEGPLLTSEDRLYSRSSLPQNQLASPKNLELEDDDDDLKGTFRTAQKIEKSLLSIKKALRSCSPQQKALSPHKSSLPFNFTVRAKNKFPLRATITEKYKFKEKLQNHKDLSQKIKELSKASKNQ